MKPEDVKTVFDRIGPDEAAKERMLDNILSHSAKEKQSSFFSWKKALPALMAVVLLAGGILTFSLKDRLFPIESSPEPFDNEDMIAPLLQQFEMLGRQYILLSDYAKEYGFPATVNPSDIGQKISTINQSPDQSLMGLEVYEYLPAGCEAVVAVKKGDVYERYRFFTFNSYQNNQDEDAVEYLKLYGIESPEDIAKVQFIVYTEESKLQGGGSIAGEITGEADKAAFYSFYSVLKNSSDKYFSILSSYSPSTKAPQIEEDTGNASSSQTPPDYTGNDSVTNMEGAFIAADLSEDGPMSVEPSQGSAGDALKDPVTVRIYNQQGVYYDTMYYQNIGFLSRYEVSLDFAALIESYIK